MLSYWIKKFFALPREPVVIRVGSGSVIYHRGRCRETIIFEVDPNANSIVKLPR